MAIEYVLAEQARHLPGLRLVLTRDVPGPWGEAAKAIMRAKGISFVPVQQYAGDHDPILLEWTGQTSAPVAVFENERPRTTWLEILLLVERLSPEPPLVPADPRLRTWLLGLMTQICSEGGLAWHARQLMFNLMRLGTPQDHGSANIVQSNNFARLTQKYEQQEGTLMDSRNRIEDILILLDQCLASSGGQYFMGDRPMAIDYYWACFSNMFAALPQDICPMSDWYLKFATLQCPEIIAPPSTALLRHRDNMFTHHIDSPLSF
jgi:glutathione S-transferase